MFTASNIISAETISLLGDSGKRNSGWGGYLQLLVGGYQAEGLSNVSDNNAQIVSLNAKPASNNESFIVPAGLVYYNIANSNTMLFLGTPDTEILESEVFIEAGISHMFYDGTVLAASYTPKISAFAGEAWQDPFITNRPREKTDTTVKAARLAAEYILGSPFSFKYYYSEQLIMDDKAGESLSPQLTSTELNLLKRDIKFHRARFLVTVPMGDSLVLIPGLTVTRADAKGAANSYTANGIDLTVAYQHDRFEVYAFAYANTADYRTSNPVFNKQRQDDNYGTTLGFSIYQPLGWQNTTFELYIGSYSRNTNIHFYDKRSELLATGLTFKF